MNEAFGKSFNGMNYTQAKSFENELIKNNDSDYRKIQNELAKIGDDARELERFTNHLKNGKDNKTKNIIAVIEANKTRKANEDNPAAAYFYSNVPQTTQSGAVAVNPNTSFVSRVPKFDDKGNFNGYEVLGKSKTVDQELQASIQTNPSLHVIKDLSGNKFDVKPDKVVLGSVNRIRNSDKVTTNATVYYKKKMPVYDNDGVLIPNKYRLEDTKKEVIIESTDTNYDDKRAREFESGILSGDVTANNKYPEGVGASKKVGNNTIYTLTPQASEIQKANYREYNAIKNKSLNSQMEDAKDSSPGNAKTITDNWGGANVTFKIHKVDDSNTGGRYTAEILGNEINADSYEELQSQIYNIKNQYLIRK